MTTRRPSATDLQATLMRTDLKALLDRAPGSRPVLKHLAMLEIRLRLEGPAVVEQLSTEALRQCAQQLETVLPHTVPQGVAALRARLDVAMLGRERETSREHQPSAAAPTSFGAPSSLLSDDKLEVRELSLTDFHLEVQGWAPTEPDPSLPRPAAD